jgi:ssDNA-binding Zn-finger/Zn-ribbon topoisomerase 1
VRRRNAGSRSSRSALGKPTPKPLSITSQPRRTDLRCPDCEGPMSIRPAGKSASGKPYPEFAGCVRYPNCKGTRPLPKSD